jgi:DNA polymerase-4
MDAFYASVEIRDRPELAGQPVIVGATGGRGVVLSASYPARAFGVRSAMPVMRARRLCPQAVFVPPRHRAYAMTSKEVMAIFGTVTPEVEPLALDEAFLDVSGALRRLGPPAAIAAGIRVQVQQQQGITCSVGVAPTKFVAKIASARCKPDGLLVVPQGGVLDFLHPLPVAALWGVGDRAGEVLARLGLRTVGDIARTPLDTLQRELGAAHGAHLAALAWGRDERRVTPHTREKSIGAEETFATDIDDQDRIRRELLRLSGRTAQGLRAAGYVARTVSVKLRLASFKTLTRSRTLPYPTDVAREIYTTACSLYESSGLDRGARLRLVGVRVSGLVPAAEANTQLTFDDRPVGWREAEQALDQIARRFGASAVRPAALVDDPGLRDRPGGEAFLPATGSTLPSGVSTLVFWKKNRVCEVKVTAHVPGAWFLGGVVPLSEHEQRQLEQIEQALYREDPKFGRVVRSSDPRVHYKRKLVQAVIGILVGAGALAAGVVTHRVWLDGAGAAVVLLSLLWAIVSWRRHVARVRPARTKVSQPRAVASGRSRAGWRARLMERMEERWRRRQEGDRRM